MTATRVAARELSVAEAVARVDGGGVGPAEDGGESCGAGEGSRRRSGRWRAQRRTAVGVKRAAVAGAAAHAGGRGVGNRRGCE